MENNTKVILVFFIIIVILVAIMYFSTSRINNKENENVVVNVSNGFLPGLGSGEIKIIEFSDFACPVCKSNDPIIKELVERYEDKISFYYRNFPLPMHENSFEASLASMCAEEQGKFWEYHDLLFENQGKFERDSLKNYALQLNLNEEQFNECLDNEKYEDEVNKDIENGKKAGVKGTPTFFVNNERIEGFKDFEFFKELIEKS